MREEIKDLIIRRNARHHQVVSSTGWVVILIAVFVVTVLGVYGISAIVNRDVYPLATALPNTLRPTAVSWTLDSQVQPGGMQVYTAPETVKRQTVSAFIDGWNSIAFQTGFPDEVGAQEILSQHFWPEGPAYHGASEIITSARQTGTYWRREIVGQVSLSNLVEFAQTGDEARFSFGLPASSVRNELIDIGSGMVIASRAQAVVLNVTMRYDPAASRWMVYEIQATQE